MSGHSRGEWYCSLDDIVSVKRTQSTGRCLASRIVETSTVSVSSRRSLPLTQRSTVCG